MRSNAKYSLRKVRGRRGKGTKKKKKVCCFNCKHSYALKCFHIFQRRGQHSHAKELLEKSDSDSRAVLKLRSGQEVRPWCFFA